MSASIALVLRHANTIEQIVPKPHYIGLSASQILEI